MTQAPQYQQFVGRPGNVTSDGVTQEVLRKQGRSGAQCVVDGLISNGCQVLFGYPGGTVIDIFDKLYDSPLKFVLPRHEQGGIHMADGYARATGKVGCALVTSGPGATNAVTGLATAMMDGIPLVVISGQVAMNLIGTDAFQEADTTGITRGVTKHNFLVRSVDELPRIIAEAFFIASTGKPGPVLIDIPKNIQQQYTLRPDVSMQDVAIRAYQPMILPPPEQVARLADAINKSHRPVLYVGGGAIVSNSCSLLRSLAETYDIPVCTTMMGLGAFPETSPLSLWMVGMHGSVAANQAIQQADLVISAGARFDDRVTGRTSEFARSAQIAHIDVDASAIGKNVGTDIAVCADLHQTLEALLPLVRKVDRSAWLKQIATWREAKPAVYLPRKDGKMLPQAVIETIDRVSAGKATIVTDVGQNQMWAAQFYRYTRPRSFLSSGGLGTMGFGVPAAVGAQLGCPDALVVSINGDGGFQMNIQELVVAVEHKLPVKFVILNNTRLGMVRQWQDLFYNGRHSATILTPNNRPTNERITCEEEDPIYLPDFVKVAEAYGIRSKRVKTLEEAEKAFTEAFNDPHPWLIECIVAEDENVLPMVPPGAALSEMILPPRA
jgi:acetolactate synthase-1/2/3 large subunit